MSLPGSQFINSLEAIYHQDGQVNYENAFKENEHWVLRNDRLEEADWFMYRVNGDFVICDALTKDSLFLEEGFCATKNTYLEKKLRDFKFSAVLCLEIDQYNRPTKKTKYFTNFNPAVLLSFQIESKDDLVMVVTTEWISSSKLYWMSANHYTIEKQKESYSALAITPDTPSGNWIVNTYLGTTLYPSLTFVLDNKSKQLSPRSTFVDMKL
jgi:hypothetical protein